MLNIKKISLIIIATLTLGFLPNLASAEDMPITLSISPAVQEIRLEPGEITRKEIKVVNRSENPVALKIYAENFEASDPFGGMKFNTDDTKQFSSSSWINFNNPNMVLESNAVESLSLNIECPKDAEPGGHYSVVFFEPVYSSELNENSSLGVSQRIGALLFITVAGNNVEQGQVLGATATDKCSGLQCSFKSPGLLEWGPVPFRFDFQNTGNVHVKVKGKIEIYNIFNKKVAEVAVDEKTVLPESTRNFKTTWLRRILLGRYKSKLLINYGTQNRSETATTTFWVFPYKIAIGLLVFTTIIIGLILYRKRRKKT